MRLPLKQIILSLLMLTLLTACFPWDDIVNIITGAKGKRKISFYVFEPCEIFTKPNNDIDKDKGFVSSDWTKGLHKTFVKGIVDHGDGKWTALYYDEPEPFKNFYSRFFEAVDRRKFLHDYIADIRAMADADYKNTEAIIFSIVDNKPGALAKAVTVYIYDIMTNSFVSKSRALPKESTELERKEAMAEMLQMSLEKAYGEKK